MAVQAIRSAPDPGRTGGFLNALAAPTSSSGATPRTGSRPRKPRRHRSKTATRGRWLPRPARRSGGRGAPGVSGVRRDRGRAGSHGLRRRRLSRWYIRRKTVRGLGAPTGATDAERWETLHEVLVTSTRLLAPAAPFVPTGSRADRGHVGAPGAFPDRPGPAGPGAAPGDGGGAKARLPGAGRPGDQAAPRTPARCQVQVWSRRSCAAGLADLLDILAAEVNAKATEVAGSDHELVRLKGNEYRSLASVTGRTRPGPPPQCPSSPRNSWKHWNVVTRAVRRLRSSDPKTLLVTREVVSDWAVQADGPYVRGRSALTDRSDPGRPGARAGESRPAPRKEQGYESTPRASSSAWRARQRIVAAVSAFQGFVEG